MAARALYCAAFKTALVWFWGRGNGVSRWRAMRWGGERNLSMQTLLAEYLPILIFLGIAVGLTLLIVAVSLIAGPHRPDSEKLSPYECGFEAFDDARRRFDVRFYLVSLLFIIFDLEVAFLFPWAISLGDVGVFGFWSMVIFLGVLTVGFIYEWKKGALDWE
jgi:NADH-quinone oxidoreductase subunit A